MTTARTSSARRGEAREHPLDSILGTGAAVRVLRSLHGGEQLAPPYIARSTRLSRPAVRDALIRLERAGIVERVGQGRSVLYRMASGHPLYRRIVKLFRAESRRAVILLTTLAAAHTVRAQSPRDSAQRPADMIVTGGHVYTADDSRPAATAFAVRGGRFVFVGSTSEALALRGPRTRVLDLHGATVLPGLADAHGHLLELGETLGQVDLVGVPSYDSVIARVAARARGVAPETWILGHGWDQNRWPRKDFPAHEALSRAVPRNPVVLTRVDGHALLANAAAMSLAGVTAATPDPPGGRIVRDSAGGPTGVFVDNAQSLVTHVIPAPTRETIARDLAAAIREVHRWGLTSVHDPGERRRVIDVMEEMARAGRLDLRTYVMIADDSADIAHYFTLGPRSALYGGFLWIRAIKLYADGALGSRGAALLSPYSDDPGNSGLLTSTEGHIESVAEAALRHGFQVATHAIGDRGNRNALDAYETALHRVPRADHRFRVEHAQVLDPADIPRFALLGVIPSMQASHQTSDMRWAQDRLGPSRVRGAYAWRSLLRTGVVIPDGSDFPVERVNPLISFHSAVTREDATGWPAGGWYPEQRMTRDEALRAMTIWPAYAAFQNRLLGSITPGKFADFTVLDRDIMTVPAREIPGTRVLATYVGGRAVYEAAGFAHPLTLRARPASKGMGAHGVRQ